MTTMEFQNNHQSQISNNQNSQITSSEKDDQDKDQKQNSNLNRSNPVPQKEAIKNRHLIEFLTHFCNSSAVNEEVVKYFHNGIEFSEKDNDFINDIPLAI